ncbi:MAG: hypothetical protein WD342_08050, partial [Verrucomicrobiales bacterium]
MPKEFAGFKIAKITDFAQSEFDGSNVGLSYTGDGSTLGVYFYNREPAFEAGREQKELEQSLDAIRYLARQGKYENLEIPDTIEITEYGNDDSPHQLAGTVCTFSESGEGTESESYSGITYVGDFAVKIRHTMDLSGEQDSDEAKRGSRSEAIDFIISMIKEANFRPLLHESIETLREDPTEPDASAIVVGYTEASRILQVTVAPEWLPFLGDEDFDKSTSLLASFVAGNIEAQFRELVFESQNREGILRMLEAYEILRDTGKCRRHEILESWCSQVDAGTFELPSLDSDQSEVSGVVSGVRQRGFRKVSGVTEGFRGHEVSGVISGFRGQATFLDISSREPILNH